MLYKWTFPSYITKIPQCETMTEKYYMDIDLSNHFPSGKNGVETLRGKIDYQPFADAFVMHYHTKRTDYVTSSRMSRLSWLITPHFADFLYSYSLPEHQIFDAWIEHRSKRYPYKIVHFCFENLEVINFEQSTWYITKRGFNSQTYKKVTVLSAEDYQEQSKILPFEKVIKAHKLIFIDDIQTDIVKLIHPCVGLFIHERLKIAIQAANFTGIDFKPVGNSFYQHLTWAETGLLVEECHCDYCESPQNKP